MKLLPVVLLALILGSCATTYPGQGQKAGGDTVVLCHKGNKSMELPREAADAHINHGDHYGPCN